MKKEISEEEVIEVTDPRPSVEDLKNDLVTVFIRKDGAKDEDALFVAVNGKGFLIKKGVPVAVPRYVEAVLKQQRIAEETAEKYQEELLAKAVSPQRI